MNNELELMLLAAAEKAIGFTKEQVEIFRDESYTQHPEKDLAWHHDDIVGKFEHMLRGKIGGAVDAAWPFLKPYATEVVDIVLTNGGA